MRKTNIYRTAIAADAALNALGRDVADDEIDACDDILGAAYEHVPASLADIAGKMDTVLAIEDVEPVIRVALEATRDGTRRMADGLEIVRDALNTLRCDATDDEARACAATILVVCRTFPDLLDVVIAFAHAILSIERKVEPATRIVLVSIRDAAKRLAR